MRSLHPAIWLALMAALSAWTSLAIAHGAFVKVRGRQFVVGDRVLYFVGANLNVMHGPRARRLAELTIAAAAKDGLTVGRVWALGEGTAKAPDWSVRDELFRAGPSGWQEAAFVQLDRVIALAARHGLRLIITLSNTWRDYGGVPMYLRWAKQRDINTYGYSDRFFRLPQVKRWFQQHLRRIVGRTNSITGIPYRDDPTIMAWELQNEMRGTLEAAALRRAWVQKMTRYIRSMDPNHLVVPGTIGYSMQRERSEWIRMCQLPEVAYCDQHIYPQEHLLSRHWADLRRAIDDRVQLAHHVVGKPIVFGEYGFADRGSAKVRARLNRRFLSRVFHDGGNGAIVWIYQPTLSWKRRYGILVDDRRYRGLRRALGGMARSVARRPPKNRNPRIGPSRGRKPLAPTHLAMTGWRHLHQRWRPLSWGRLRPPKGLPHPPPEPPRYGASCRKLTIPVGRFHRAYFEDAGHWPKGVLEHAYGRRTGYFEYRFVGAGFRPTRVVIEARISSEYPGSVAPAHGLSTVRVHLDGRLVGVLQAPPDDGIGRSVQVEVIERGLLDRFARRGHRLRFEVLSGAYANGLALYGREAKGNREPVVDPQPLRIIACPSE